MTPLELLHATQWALVICVGLIVVVAVAGVQVVLQRRRDVRALEDSDDEREMRDAVRRSGAGLTYIRCASCEELQIASTLTVLEGVGPLQFVCRNGCRPGGRVGVTTTTRPAA